MSLKKLWGNYKRFPTSCLNLSIQSIASVSLHKTGRNIREKENIEVSDIANASIIFIR